MEMIAVGNTGQKNLYPEIQGTDNVDNIVWNLSLKYDFQYHNKYQISFLCIETSQFAG